MILTKDNIIRFIRERKYITPTDIAENFETTTMIASAALSELSKEKSVLISNMKFGSTPYYYDPLQKEALQELGERNFSGNDKDMYRKLKEQQVLNHNGLSAAEKLAVSKIPDFAKELVIEHQGNQLRFWVWYLRDINDTRRQILDVLNPKKESVQQIQKKPITNNEPNRKEPVQQVQRRENTQKTFMPENDDFESKVEKFIDNFFAENYLRVENKIKEDKNIKYETSLKLNKMKILFDCMYFSKKPTDGDVLKFYSSSQKPKIVFIENAPKKIFKLAENLENIFIINI